MEWTELMGWLALILNIWGNFALTQKSIKGWLIRLACNVAFIIYSYAFGVWPLLVNHVIFAGVNIFGWLEWSKDIYKCSCGRQYENVNGGMCICELPLPTPPTEKE
jgi:nicotinamide riboside transporter PnuC